MLKAKFFFLFYLQSFLHFIHQVIIGFQFFGRSYTAPQKLQIQYPPFLLFLSLFQIKFFI
nr:MAG TPA: hypothetical protein [Caudoviricetes sp.]